MGGDQRAGGMQDRCVVGQAARAGIVRQRAKGGDEAFLA
jgi:hypothetical protein